MSPPLRVCDRCIRKKQRCNRQRPACSRCAELGESCSYTSVKRKPGPPLGSHYSSTRGRSRRTTATADPVSHSAPVTGSLAQSLVVTPATPATPATSSQEQSTASATPRAPLSFPPGQVESLLLRYFDILQDANPIASPDRFLRRCRDGRCSPSLVSTICVITARLTGEAAADDNKSHWDACIDVLLSSSMLHDDLTGDACDVSPQTLDAFRRAYLLALYEFHQFPGHQSWLRVGRVTRMAYRLGLDRLDHVRTRYPDWQTVHDDDLQEWRALWWCLYRLDAYANLSCGTPYLIDDAVVATSLVDADERLFLPSSLDDMVHLLAGAPASTMHTISIATLRQAGRVLGLRLQRSPDVLAAQVTRAERHLATVRLALPTGWLAPQRRALAGEAHGAHHARLVTVLHLHMARLLLAVADPRLQDAEPRDDWLAAWQRVLVACQDIATVAAAWDSAYCLAVDPAICFIVFTALCFLDLQRKMGRDAGDAADAATHAAIEHGITVLLLQLQHFAGIWTVPKLLKLSFESFHQSIRGPIPHSRVATILSRFEAPFHPKWLQFLSSTTLT